MTLLRWFSGGSFVVHRSIFSLRRGGVFFPVYIDARLDRVFVEEGGLERVEAGNEKKVEGFWVDALRVV